MGVAASSIENYIPLEMKMQKTLTLFGNTTCVSEEISERPKTTLFLLEEKPIQQSHHDAAAEVSTTLRLSCIANDVVDTSLSLSTATTRVVDLPKITDDDKKLNKFSKNILGLSLSCLPTNSSADEYNDDDDPINVLNPMPLQSFHPKNWFFLENIAPSCSQEHDNHDKGTVEIDIQADHIHIARGTKTNDAGKGRKTAISRKRKLNNNNAVKGKPSVKRTRTRTVVVDDQIPEPIEIEDVPNGIFLLITKVCARCIDQEEWQNMKMYI
ncbi:hypothetical protein DH2020_024386 [Rehmannia glutinosa]|uniref:Uncharacterized protein n=1 Tax=Rehmannia glutinosa TaxID=99300 RepID=A0ABR0W732_REHGL